VADETLFDMPCVVTVPSPRLSADRARTLRQRQAIANGQHPLMGGPIDPDHTCGICAHHVVQQRNRTWHKCDLKLTFGPATDIRVGWPACQNWEARRD
jgi:hypothetical protein